MTSFADIIINAIEKVAEHQSLEFMFFQNIKTRDIHPKCLNSYLAGISSLYAGFMDEGLNVDDDECIVKHLKNFEAFNEIRCNDHFFEVVDKIRDAKAKESRPASPSIPQVLQDGNTEPLKISKEDLIYNSYYLQIEPFIKILRSYGWYPWGDKFDGDELYPIIGSLSPPKSQIMGQ